MNPAAVGPPTGVFEGSNPCTIPPATTGTSTTSFGQALNEKLILPLGKLLTEKKKKDDVAVRLQEKLRRAEQGEEEEEEEEDDDEDEEEEEDEERGQPAEGEEFGIPVFSCVTLKMENHFRING